MTQEPISSASEVSVESGSLEPQTKTRISGSGAWISRLPAILAVLAVIVATSLIATTYSVFNQTTDEAQHFAAGLEWLDAGTYNYETLTPPLARAATAVGPYLAGVRGQGVLNVWAEGNTLLAYQGHYQRTLTLARLGTLPFFWLACFVMWRFAARNYEPWLATLAVVFFAFCPLVLAHAGLATVDMGVTAMFLCALISFWNFLQQPKASSAALAAFTAGLAVLCKLSAVPYLGVSCGALYLYFAIKTKRLPPWKYVGVGVLTIALTIWAGYRFSVGPVLQKARLTPLMAERLQHMPPSEAKALLTIPVPAPSFFLGIIRAVELNKARLEYGYLLGQTYQGGRWDFFPVGIAVKTPIPFLLLAIFGVVLVLIRRAPNFRAAADRHCRPAACCHVEQRKHRCTICSAGLPVPCHPGCVCWRLALASRFECRDRHTLARPSSLFSSCGMSSAQFMLRPTSFLTSTKPLLPTTAESWSTAILIGVRT